MKNSAAKSEKSLHFFLQSVLPLAKPIFGLEKRENGAKKLFEKGSNDMEPKYFGFAAFDCFCSLCAVPLSRDCDFLEFLFSELREMFFSVGKGLFLLFKIFLRFLSGGMLSFLKKFCEKRIFEKVFLLGNFQKGTKFHYFIVEKI